MGIAFRLIAAPYFHNLPPLTRELSATTSPNWTDYCKMLSGSARVLLRGLPRDGPDRAADDLHSFGHVMLGRQGERIKPSRAVSTLLKAL